MEEKNLICICCPLGCPLTVALENGEVDMIHKVPSEEVARLETLEGITVLKQPGVGQRLFRFGCNDEIMSNTKVRQALNYAVDRLRKSASTRRSKCSNGACSVR